MEVPIENGAPKISVADVYRNPGWAPAGDIQPFNFLNAVVQIMGKLMLGDFDDPKVCSVHGSAPENTF